MAKFEEMMEKIGNMSDEERQEKIQEIKDICDKYCGNCPSYLGTGETELGFCVTGKAENINEEKGCLCGDCPVTDMMGLEWGYYCTRGSAKQQNS